VGVKGDNLFDPVYPATIMNRIVQLRHRSQTIRNKEGQFDKEAYSPQAYCPTFTICFYLFCNQVKAATAM